MKFLVYVIIALGGVLHLASTSHACQGEFEIDAHGYGGDLVIRQTAGERFRGHLTFHGYPREQIEGVCSQRTGSISFYRSFGSQQYSGNVYGGSMSGSFTSEGNVFAWTATAKSVSPQTPRDACVGQFAINAAGYSGTLSLQSAHRGVQGHMYFPGYPSDRVVGECYWLGPRRGRISVTRLLQSGAQHFTGTFVERGGRLQLTGEYNYLGSTYPWSSQ